MTQSFYLWKSGRGFCLSRLAVRLLQHSGGTKAEFFQCSSILHLKRRGSTFMGVQLAKGILCESSIIQ